MTSGVITSAYGESSFTSNRPAGVITRAYGETQGISAGVITRAYGESVAVVSTVVNAGGDATVEPFQVATISASAQAPVDSWVIQQTAGPAVQLFGDGPDWQYVTPGLEAGAVCTFLVSAVQSGQLDAKHQALLDVLRMSATQAVRWAFLGSSTTVGNNATTVANRYVNRVSASERVEFGAAGTTAALDSSAAPTAPGLHTRNGGQGSTTSANYVPPARHAFITAFQPHIVMHMIGSNDFGNSLNPATYKTNIQTVIDAIDAEVTGPVLHILVNAYQRTDVTGSFPFAQYGVKLAELEAANSNVTYIDLNPLYIARGIPGSDPDNLIDTDNLHPTNAGHAFMAAALQERVVGLVAGGSGSDSVTHTVRGYGGPWFLTLGGEWIPSPIDKPVLD